MNQEQYTEQLIKAFQNIGGNPTTLREIFTNLHDVEFLRQLYEVVNRVAPVGSGTTRQGEWGGGQQQQRPGG